MGMTYICIELNPSIVSLSMMILINVFFILVERVLDLESEEDLDLNLKPPS